MIIRLLVLCLITMASQSSTPSSTLRKSRADTPAPWIELPSNSPPSTPSAVGSHGSEWSAQSTPPYNEALEGAASRKSRRATSSPSTTENSRPSTPLSGGSRGSVLSASHSAALNEDVLAQAAISLQDRTLEAFEDHKATSRAKIDSCSDNMEKYYTLVDNFHTLVNNHHTLVDNHDRRGFDALVAISKGNDKIATHLVQVDANQSDAWTNVEESFDEDNDMEEEEEEEMATPKKLSFEETSETGSNGSLNRKKVAASVSTSAKAGTSSAKATTPLRLNDRTVKASLAPMESFGYLLRFLFVVFKGKLRGTCTKVERFINGVVKFARETFGSSLQGTHPSSTVLATPSSTSPIRVASSTAIESTPDTKSPGTQPIPNCASTKVSSALVLRVTGLLESVMEETKKGGAEVADYRKHCAAVKKVRKETMHRLLDDRDSEQSQRISEALVEEMEEEKDFKDLFWNDQERRHTRLDGVLSAATLLLESLLSPNCVIPSQFHEQMNGYSDVDGYGDCTQKDDSDCNEDDETVDN